MSCIDITALTVGDRVWHEKFAMGTVLEIDDRYVIVHFDANRQRKLSAAHVRLYAPSKADARPIAHSLSELRHLEKRAQQRHDYEREFPYDEPAQTKGPVERLSRRSPTVSGGLPSLGKRR